jgi:hypothetical protein
VKDGVVEVCLNNGIKLSPISPHPTYPDKCNGYETFPITTFYEEGWCSNVENQLNVISCETSWFGLKCRCKFWKIFISITEVNNNLSPIGTEYFEWKSLSYDDIKNADFHTFPLLNYLPQNINLYPNKYYKIKLAGSNYSGWDEGTRYIHTYSENININGSNPTNNVYGKDITIQNSTITQPIEVVASESIHFLPGTHLTAGHYYIDENQNCNSFKMESMLRVGNNDIGNNKSTTSNYNKNELILSNQKTSDKSNNSINIYPNPTNGKFNINIDTNFEGLIELKLIDLFTKI